MKSQHRHELETNVLAKQLDAAVERFRPYASTIVGVVVAVAVLLLLWSYFAKSSTARQSRAWDEFNVAVMESVPDIEQLRQAAQEHPGTTMQQMADVTWADGQVYIAARDYLYNRPAAMEALNKALSAYQSVIQTSDDERLVNRARWGVARVYEIQGKLDEAREAYLQVQGAFQELAKFQADRLAEPEAKETYAWLATARPQLRAPLGPGTPGQRPEFSADELALPGSVTGTAPAANAPESQSIEELLKGLELDFGPTTGEDKYAPGGTSPAQAQEGPPSESENQAAPASAAGDQESPTDNGNETATDAALDPLPFGDPPADDSKADATQADKAEE